MEVLGGIGSLSGDTQMVAAPRVEGEVIETTANYAQGSEIASFGPPAYDMLNNMEGVWTQNPGTVRVSSC